MAKWTNWLNRATELVTGVVEPVRNVSAMFKQVNEALSLLTTDMAALRQDQQAQAAWMAEQAKMMAAQAEIMGQSAATLAGVQDRLGTIQGKTLEEQEILQAVEDGLVSAAIILKSRKAWQSIDIAGMVEVLTAMDAKLLGEGLRQLPEERQKDIGLHLWQIGLSERAKARRAMTEGERKAADAAEEVDRLE